MTIRQLLLRVPVLGKYVERRWMPDPVERDAHREVVRGRLEEPLNPAPPAEPAEPADPAESPRLTGGAPED